MHGTAKSCNHCSGKCNFRIWFVVDEGDCPLQFGLKGKRENFISPFKANKKGHLLFYHILN